jgi:hypothetical protein
MVVTFDRHVVTMIVIAEVFLKLVERPAQFRLIASGATSK